MDIAVIGAGPAGCWYAAQAGGKGVHILEEHERVGEPVSCTGILTDSAVGVMGEIPPELIINRIKVFKIVAPSGRSMYVNLDKVNLILDRGAFDRHLLKLALDAGASLHLGERFLSYRSVGSRYEVLTTRGRHVVDMIVGADGPESPVAKAAGLYGDRKFVRGLQARCRYPGLEPEVTAIHLNLGEFSWVVPESGETARVGVIGPDEAALERDYRQLLGAAEVLEDQSGIIPVYDPHQKLRRDGERVFLIGDAATQVKATTYGGIIYGLLAGTFLAQDPELYVERISAKVARDLWISLQMRDLMNHMTEDQANELIDIFEKERNREIIARHDRDFPSRFIVQLLMKEAKLWKLGFNLLKNKVLDRPGSARLAEEPADPGPNPS